MSSPSISAHQAALAQTLFILGDFPARSQTFIQREMAEMVRQGLPVKVAALNRIEGRESELDQEVRAIVDQGVYLNRFQLDIIGALGRALQRPGPVYRTLQRILSLPLGSPYHRLRFLLALAAAVRLAPLAAARNIRYVQAHFAGLQTEVALCLSWLTGIRFGAFWHAYGIYRDRSALREKIAAAQMILTCTEFNRRHLCTLAPDQAHKIHLCRHGIDLGRAPQPEPLLVSDSPQWLAVGRLVPKKGFATLISAAGLLADRGYELCLVIAGDGPGRQRLQGQIHRLGLARQVRLIGFQPQAKIWTLLGQSRALVAPSVRAADGDLDGLPNVVLEAMSAARPVVGSAISGLPEAILHEQTGLLVRPGDPAALADALERLAADTPLARRLGEQGRLLVESEFDLPTNVAAQVELLTRAASNASGN